MDAAGCLWLPEALALSARLHCALISLPLEYFRPLGSFIFQSLLKNMYMYFLLSLSFLPRFFPAFKVLVMLTLNQVREEGWSCDTCKLQESTVHLKKYINTENGRYG